MNQFITNVDVLGLEEIEGWRVSECEMSGTIEWYDGNGTFIYATPHWHEPGVVPFDTHTNETAEYENVKKLFLQKNTSRALQLETYIKTLKKVINVI